MPSQYYLALCVQWHRITLLNAIITFIEIVIFVQLFYGEIEKISDFSPQKGK